jgi:predicted TIM-barrel fold metal-dependent hydrolase
MARKEYELTAEQFDRLIEACRSAPLIMLQCGMPASPQENANRAWIELGKELGFDGMTVEPSGKGQRFFTAESSNA